MPQKNSDLIMELPDFTNALNETEQILRQCLKQYKLNEIFLSFNGGKDCTVLLDIAINILRDLYRRDGIEKELKIVYMRTSSPFREMETFVEQVGLHYGVALTVTEAGDMKETLRRILERDAELKACLMGTRRTDPYSENLDFMQMTDPDWPQIIRVSPLLNWSYHQIWNYIFQKNVPYCSLYDKGYTSIGNTMNTRPNPSLVNEDCCGGGRSYLPAWRLSNAALERAGRGAPPVQHANGHEACSTNGHAAMSNGSGQ